VAHTVQSAQIVVECLYFCWLQILGYNQMLYKPELLVCKQIFKYREQNYYFLDIKGTQLYKHTVNTMDWLPVAYPQ
jgi:hypothetical protein